MFNISFLERMGIVFLTIISMLGICYIWDITYIKPIPFVIGNAGYQIIDWAVYQIRLK